VKKQLRNTIRVIIVIDAISIRSAHGSISSMFNHLHVSSLHWPHLSRSLASVEQVILDLVAYGGNGISVDKSKAGEENTNKDGAPEELVYGNLREYWTTAVPGMISSSHM